MIGYLTVKFFFSAAPKYEGTDDGQGKVGASSEMACSFRARPPPRIAWIRNGNVIEQDFAKYEIAEEKKSDVEVKSYLKILK